MATTAMPQPWASKASTSWRCWSTVRKRGHGVRSWLGSAPRTSRAQPLDMEASLKAQGIHSIEELMQVLQGEIDKNRQ